MVYQRSQFSSRFDAKTSFLPSGENIGNPGPLPIFTVDTTAPDFGDPSVQFVTVPGTHDREAALVVRTPNGTTLVLNDLVGNIRDASGIGGWLLGLAGFAGESAQIPRVVKLNLVKDANALRAQLLQWTEMDSLKRILVSHGEPVLERGRAALAGVLS